MCVSPRYIKNVYRSHPNYWRGLFPHVSPLTKEIRDVDSDLIPVPCGDCVQCRSRKQTDLLQRVQMESLSSYVYMFTLTYNKNVPTYSLPNGKVLMRAEYKHVVDMFKRIRKTDYFNGRRFKYLVCSEFSPLRARPHFHGLLFLKKLPTDSQHEYITLEKLAFDTILKEWRVNVATRVAKKDSKKYKAGDIIPDTRRPKYLPLLDYHRTFRGGKWRSTYDLHYVTPNDSDGSNDVSFYVTKYLFKSGNGEKFVQAACYNSVSSKEHAKQIYNDHFKSMHSKSLNLGSAMRDDSRYLRSQGYNNTFWMNKDVSDKIRSMVDLCESHDLPLSFFDIYTGKWMPLSRYYYKLLSIPRLLDFQKRMKLRIDSGEFEKDITDSYNKAMKKYNQQSKRSVITDIFDDDEVLSIDVSIQDDLPDPSYYSISDLSDEELHQLYTEDISPDLSFEPDYDLPDPQTRIHLYKQLSLDLS